MVLTMETAINNFESILGGKNGIQENPIFGLISVVLQTLEFWAITGIKAKNGIGQMAVYGHIP
jgi:hypothetical protein